MWAALVSADIYGWNVVSRGEGVEVGYPWREIKYSPLLWSLVPDSVVIPSLVSRTVSLLRVAVKPASQNWPKERRGCWSAGKTPHFREARGGWGKGSRAVCIATMVSPLGMRTIFPPCNTATLLPHGQVDGRKWLVQPESATVNSTGGVTSV